MKHACRIFWLMILLLVTGLVFAQQQHMITPEDNGLPYFVTVAPFPLDKGVFELITIPQYSKAEESFAALYESITYGVTDSFMAYVIFTTYALDWFDWQDRQSGVGDIDFGYQKTWMYINKSTFSSSFLFNIHVPTGDINKRLTNGFLRYEPNLILTKDFLHDKFRTQFFSQIGFSIVQRIKEHADPAEDDPPAHYFILNSGISLRYEKVNYTLEFNWFTNEWNNNGDDNEFYVTPGIYVVLTNHVAIGLAVAIGLTEDSYDYQIIGNLLVDVETLPKKKDKDKKNDKNKNKKKSKDIEWDKEEDEPTSTFQSRRISHTHEQLTTTEREVESKALN